MSSSATDRSAMTTAVAALVASALTAIFGAVYELFSHGVWSPFMVYAFLFPLLLDTLPFALLAHAGRPLPDRWVLNLHHAGVATLTVGSVIEGVLAIYGTTNQLTCVYWIVGPVLLISGIILHVAGRRKLH